MKPDTRSLDWAARELVSPPPIEAVMVSSEGSRALSFVRPGHPIATLPAEN